MLKMRQIILLITLVYSSYTDIKEKYIYLLPSILTVIVGIMISIVEIKISNWNDYELIMRNRLLLPIVLGIITYFLNTISNENIGKGDIVLFTVTGVMIGMKNEIYVVAISLFFAGLCGAVIFLLDKEKKVNVIPLVPFILLSYLFMLIGSNEI